MAIVEMHQVTKIFGERAALKNLSLTLEEGRFYSILGINGAGKSTLMNLLIQSQRVNAGTIRLFGKDLEEEDPSRGDQIGYVAETTKYEVNLSIRELLDHYSRFFRIWDHDLCAQLTTRLGLDFEKQPSQLSRGQLAQLGLLLALSKNPKLLLLDEITAVLDPHLRSFTLGLIARFVGDGGTVVLATNIVPETHTTFDHLVIIHDGEVKLQGPSQTLTEPFAKVRRTPGQNHAVFEDPTCVEVSINTAGSSSYLLPKTLATRLHLPADFVDPRKISNEEAFLYFTRVRGRAV